MALNKRPPTKINAGAVAQDGMMLTNGAKMIAAKNMIAVNTEVSPVLKKVVGVFVLTLAIRGFACTWLSYVLLRLKGYTITWTSSTYP